MRVINYIINGEWSDVLMQVQNEFVDFFFFQAEDGIRDSEM